MLCHLHNLCHFKPPQRSASVETLFSLVFPQNPKWSMIMRIDRDRHNNYTPCKLFTILAIPMLRQLGIQVHHGYCSPWMLLTIYAAHHLRCSPSTLLTIYAAHHLRCSPSTLLNTKLLTLNAAHHEHCSP